MEKLGRSVRASEFYSGRWGDRRVINVADSFIANRVRSGAVGKSGSIDITAGTLSLTNGTQLDTSTLGPGDAGSLNINVHDTVLLPFSKQKV